MNTELTTMTKEKKYIRQDEMPPLTTIEVMGTHGFRIIMSMLWVPTIILAIVVYKLAIKKRR